MGESVGNSRDTVVTNFNVVSVKAENICYTCHLINIGISGSRV